MSDTFPTQGRIRITLCCVGSGDRNIILSLFCLYVWLIQRLSMSCAAEPDEDDASTIYTALCCRYPDLSPTYNHTWTSSIYIHILNIQSVLLFTTSTNTSDWKVRILLPYTLQRCGWLKAPRPCIRTRTISKKIPYGANITRSDRNCVSSSRFGQKGLVYLCISIMRSFFYTI